MKAIATRMKTLALRVHRSEKGAEGLEKLLIVAAIVLPLLAVLLFFRNDIQEWVNGMWSEVKDDATDFDPGAGI